MFTVLGTRWIVGHYQRSYPRIGSLYLGLIKRYEVTISRSVVSLGRPLPYWHCLAMVYPFLSTLLNSGMQWSKSQAILIWSPCFFQTSWVDIFCEIVTNIHSVREYVCDIATVKLSKRNEIWMEVMLYNRSFTSYIHQLDGQLKSVEAAAFHSLATKI